MIHHVLSATEKKLANAQSQFQKELIKATNSKDYMKSPELNPNANDIQDDLTLTLNSAEKIALDTIEKDITETRDKEVENTVNEIENSDIDIDETYYNALIASGLLSEEQKTQIKDLIEMKTKNEANKAEEVPDTPEAAAITASANKPEEKEEEKAEAENTEEDNPIDFAAEIVAEATPDKDAENNQNNFFEEKADEYWNNFPNIFDNIKNIQDVTEDKTDELEKDLV